jgi:hypothetical protein
MKNENEKQKKYWKINGKTYRVWKNNLNNEWIKFIFICMKSWKIIQINGCCRERNRKKKYYIKPEWRWAQWLIQIHSSFMFHIFHNFSRFFFYFLYFEAHLLKRYGCSCNLQVLSEQLNIWSVTDYNVNLLQPNQRWIPCKNINRKKSSQLHSFCITKKKQKDKKNDKNHVHRTQHKQKKYIFCDKKKLLYNFSAKCKKWRW